jgi:hypothetical protein
MTSQQLYKNLREYIDEMENRTDEDGNIIYPEKKDDMIYAAGAGIASMFATGLLAYYLFSNDSNNSNDSINSNQTIEQQKLSNTDNNLPNQNGIYEFVIRDQNTQTSTQQIYPQTPIQQHIQQPIQQHTQQPIQQHIQQPIQHKYEDHNNPIKILPENTIQQKDNKDNIYKEITLDEDGNVYEDYYIEEDAD